MWSKSILLQLFFAVCLLSSAIAQTKQWRLIWDPNPENDMKLYEVYRDTDSNPTNMIATVNHPDTVYIDTDISPGIRYYYRLKAVNTSNLRSDFSDQVSAAIPKIVDLPDKMGILPDSTLTLELDDYISDPDHSESLIRWEVTGDSALTADIDAHTRILTIRSPSDWSNPETLTIRATDPDEFYDEKSIIFTVGVAEVEEDEVNVFPVPYKANDPQHTDGISFINLENGSRITVYNMLGEVVFRTDKLYEPIFRWDVKNNAQKEIRSGLYLYVIINNQKKRYASGKIIVVR